MRRHCFVLVTILSLCLAQSVKAAEPVGSTGTLKLSSRGALETTGSYLKAGSRVYFVGSDDDAGRMTVQVMVNDVVLDAVEDQNSGKLWMDGHGLSLSKEDRQALLGLAEALAKAWKNDVQLGRVPRHRDFLFRHILYWSEAPVGLPLRYSEIKVPPALGEPDIPEEEALDFLDLSLGTKAETCTSYTTTCPVFRGNCESGWKLQCKQGSCTKGKTCFRCDNTTSYLSACDYKSVSNVCHDADGTGGHCFECETLTIGCNKGGSCVGRCGPGCNPSLCSSTNGNDGEGTYTYDCAEHDRCCGLHGGCLSGVGATHCGDEYAEAYDDTIYGKCSCTGCYKP